MAGPLEGIKAVEWAAYAHSPVIGVMLSDLGADVIKVEERGVGDPFRGARSVDGAPQLLATGIHASMENCNRNKRSISLDLKKEKGREIFYKLIEKADIFYTNYGQIRAAKLKADYETLSKINPQLIYSNATGYGHKGPDSEERSLDPAAQARSGMMDSLGERDRAPSRMVGAPVDCMGATIGAFGILAALINRLRTGEGQMTNTSLLGSAIWLQIINIQTGLLRGGTREHIGMAKYDRKRPGNPLYTWYECKDGKWLLLAGGQFDRFWGKFCRVVGITEPEYVNFNAKMLREKSNDEKLVSVLDKILATRTRDEWLKIFKESDIGFAHAPVNEIADLLTDEQVIANNYFVDFDHPVAGPVKLVNHPVDYSKTPARIRSAAPEFGQHTEEVLLELGYGWEDIARFQEEEVI